MDLSLTQILLGLIAVLLFAIFIRLGSIRVDMSQNQVVNQAYNDDHLSQRREHLGNLTEHLEEIATNIQQLRSDVEDMKHVSDVFYKYKLPDKAERDMLDEVAINNEISSRLYK